MTGRRQRDRSRADQVRRREIFRVGVGGWFNPLSSDGIGSSFWCAEALVLDARLAENLARRVSVVSSTEQGNILYRRGAAERIGLLVLEREKAPLAAAAPRVVNEAALRGVPPPYLRHDVERHVARAGLLQTALSPCPHAASSSQLALDERVHGALE